jgi:hypothetical protein
MPEVLKYSIKKLSGARNVTQVAVHLSSKYKALNSKPSATKNKQKLASFKMKK